ncbi:Ca2+-dependent phosphoinositide-specific phospholipase C [Lacinutrix venerupis]|uniref:Ca2+-dependent phosphoinositide-specific phospholipase C n=1 Tax=Lacinutrix venerupis TaxID=1486034 RepID=UPI0009F91471|nr:Ca2+-dependent phosphoinositide-specific phospholipase C [Lacinutrix venerupis]
MNYIKLTVIALLAIFITNCKAQTTSITIENGTIEVPKDLKINQIQVLGTHNSYAKKRDSVIINFLNPMLTHAMKGFTSKLSDEEKEKYKEFHPNQMSFKEMISYSFPDFNAQLSTGLRSLAIDIVYDPVGGTFSKPAVYDALNAKGITNYKPFDSTGLGTPGFKVMHMPDIDFLSHYNTFEAALTDLKTWSNKNPTHAPIYIMIEAKDKGFPLFPNSAKVTPFTSDVYDVLDQTLVSILGRNKIITPDDVRGDYQTLNEAVLAKNWPTVEASQGKFIFLLLPGGAGLTTEGAYIKNHESLKGRVMFVKADAGEPHSGFLLLDNAIVRQNEIKDYVKQGYMVRTRSDIETYEAKVNDKTRANAAFSSGAQVISTDYYQDTNNYGTSYKVEMPNNKAAILNPLNSQE